MELILVLLSVAVFSLPSLVSSHNGEESPVDASVPRWFALEMGIISELEGWREDVVFRHMLSLFFGLRPCGRRVPVTPTPGSHPRSELGALDHVAGATPASEKNKSKPPPPLPTTNFPPPSPPPPTPPTPPPPPPHPSPPHITSHHITSHLHW